MTNLHMHMGWLLLNRLIELRLDLGQRLLQDVEHDFAAEHYNDPVYVEYFRGMVFNFPLHSHSILVEGSGLRTAVCADTGLPPRESEGKHVNSPSNEAVSESTQLRTNSTTYQHKKVKNVSLGTSSFKETNVAVKIVRRCEKDEGMHVK